MKFESKIISRLAAFGFFLLLAALFFATLLRDTEKYSFFENRNLTEEPQIEKQAVLSGTYFTDLERYLVDRAAGRNTLVKLNTRLSLALGKPVVNDVVVKDDVLLPFNEFDGELDEADITRRADEEARNIAAHRDAVEAYGGRYIYVAVPCQYVCREDEYPWYLENHSALTKASSKALFSAFEREGVEYVDMYAEYLAASDETKAKFASTIDNHYSIFGAYDTYLKMMERVNDRGAVVDVLAEDEMRVEKIENHYLGSRNRKLFDLWRNDEALYCIYPTRDVPFRRYNTGIEGRAGVYSLPAPGEYATYNVYMNGDMPRTTIDTERPGLPSALIYGDSFTNAVECVAWYSFGRMESVDFRHYKEKTLDELIDELRPDYVFCIRDYESLLDLTNNGQ